MLSPLTKPYFLVSIALYIAVHLGRFGWYVPNFLINSYLTDLLCMPIVLTICLVGVRVLKRIPQFILSPLMIYGMTLYYAVLFEYFLPKSSSMYTADWIDIVMYFIGASMYWLIWRKNYTVYKSQITS